MLHASPGLYHCEVVEREYRLIGQSITALFPSGFPNAAVENHRAFEERKGEIVQALHPDVIISPYMCNGLLATYLACLEVEEDAQVPDGMIRLEIPFQRYAMISCTNKLIGEAYGRIFQWMGEQGYTQKFLNRTMPIEIYYTEKDAEEERVEILIPIHGETK